MMVYLDYMIIYLISSIICQAIPFLTREHKTEV